MNIGEIRGKIDSAIGDVYYKALSERDCSGDIAPLEYEKYSVAVDTLTTILKSMIAHNGTLNKIRNFIDNNNGQYKFPKGASMVSSENDLIYPVKLFRRGGEYLFEFEDECGWLSEIYDIGDLGDRDLILLAEELGL